MKILVTGSTGFIGSHICKALLDQGRQVRAFHRPNSPLTALQGLALEHALGDITRPDDLVEAMRGVEAVFHTAAFVGRRDPRLIYQISVQGTHNVLEAARTAGVQRVVHTSSVAALGVPLEQDHHKDMPPILMNETHSWNISPGRWPYGYHKHLAEQEVQKAVAVGLDAVIVNPALVIGAGDLNRIAGDILVRVAKGGIPVVVKGGLNLIHIDDVVRGHLAALEHGKTGERYILGSENVTHVQYLQMAAAAAGVRAPALILPTALVRSLRTPAMLLGNFLSLPINGQMLEQAGYYFYFDVAKAENELALRERKPVRQAVQEAIDWYRSAGVI
jgi:dihydroflavonol-4-reductase